MLIKILPECHTGMELATLRRKHRRLLRLDCFLAGVLRNAQTVIIVIIIHDRDSANVPCRF
jgi:hypothetical protein